MNNGVNINAEVPKTTQNSSLVTSPTISSTGKLPASNALENAVKVAGQANDILTSPSNNYGIWLIALVWLIFGTVILGVLFRNKIVAFISSKLKKG